MSLPALLLATFLWVIFAYLLQKSTASTLPEIPDLSGKSPAMVAHIHQANSAARRDPGSADAIGALGMAYHANLFNKHAAVCYALAAELNPGNWRWKYYAALIKEELGEVDRVAEGLREVVDLNPRYSPAWFRLGEAALKLDRNDEAERAYQKAIEVDRENPLEHAAGIGTLPITAYATYGLARLAERRNQPEKAILLLEDLIKRHPSFGPALRQLGRVYESIGQKEKAEQCIQMASRCSPYIPPADPMQDALSEESQSSSFLLKQADLASKSRNTSRALTLLRKAVEVNKNDADALLQLGLNLLSQRQSDEALPLLERYIEVSRDYKAINKVALELFKNRRLKESLRFLQAALEINSEYAHTYNNLGCVHTALENFDQAMEYYRKAIQLQPELATIYGNIGYIYFRRGNIEEAAKNLEKALLLDEKHVDAHTYLGMVLVQKGDLDGAQKHFRRALELAPNYPLALENLRKLYSGKTETDRKR